MNWPKMYVRSTKLITSKATFSVSLVALANVVAQNSPGLLRWVERLSDSRNGKYCNIDYYNLLARCSKAFGGYIRLIFSRLPDT